MYLNNFKPRQIGGTNAKNNAVTERPILVDEHPRLSALIRLRSATLERTSENTHMAKALASK